MSIKGKLSGQASTEFSLILLVAVVVLAISIGSIAYMSNSFSSALDKRMSMYDQDRLAARVNELCLSGSGSSRELQLLGIIENLENRDWSCPVELDFPLKGNIVLRNAQGTIKSD